VYNVLEIRRDDMLWIEPFLEFIIWYFHHQPHSYFLLLEEVRGGSKDWTFPWWYFVVPILWCNMRVHLKSDIWIICLNNYLGVLSSLWFWVTEGVLCFIFGTKLCCPSIILSEHGKKFCWCIYEWLAFHDLCYIVELWKFFISALMYHHSWKRESGVMTFTSISCSVWNHLNALVFPMCRYLEKSKYAIDNFIISRFSDIDSNLKLIVYTFSDCQFKFNLIFESNICLLVFVVQFSSQLYSVTDCHTLL
jgi:hypothetical protein